VAFLEDLPAYLHGRSRHSGLFRRGGNGPLREVGTEEADFGLIEIHEGSLVGVPKRTEEGEE